MLDRDEWFVLILASLMILLSGCGGWQEPVIRKAPADGGYINTLFNEIEKLNSHCIEWETGYYVSPTGLKSYEFCVKYDW